MCVLNFLNRSGYTLVYSEAIATLVDTTESDRRAPYPFPQEQAFSWICQMYEWCWPRKMPGIALNSGKVQTLELDRSNCVA